MRTDSERIEAMHERAMQLKSRQRRKRAQAAQVIASVACFSVVLVMAMAMPELEQAAPTSPFPTMSGSMFTDSGALGHVVVGTISFFLGAAVTAFCFHLRAWRDREERESKDTDEAIQDQDPQDRP
jgi:Mn2+/Fe2+ NRAMP family transporter